MKMCFGFVTNSSSSSFILATTKEFTEEQNEIILNYAKEKLLGNVVASTREELDAFFRSFFDIDVTKENWQDSCSINKAKYYFEAQKAIEQGKEIRIGRVDFEESDWDLADIYRSLWKELSNTEFQGIETSLDY